MSACPTSVVILVLVHPPDPFEVGGNVGEDGRLLVLGAGVVMGDHAGQLEVVAALADERAAQVHGNLQEENEQGVDETKQNVRIKDIIKDKNTMSTTKTRRWNGRSGQSSAWKVI